MRRKRCDRIHETKENNNEMVWVEVYVVCDQEWVVEVYDMCDCVIKNGEVRTYEV